jgi:hypothetical protein
MTNKKLDTEGSTKTLTDLAALLRPVLNHFNGKTKGKGKGDTLP